MDMIEAEEILGVEMIGAMRPVDMDMIEVEPIIGVDMNGALEGVSMDMIGTEKLLAWNNWSYGGCWCG